MFAQKSNHFVLPTIMLAIVFTILSLIMVQAASSQSLPVSIDSIPNAGNTVISVTAGDVAETAEFLMFNHQSGGLTHNWDAFQASLNHADYRSSSSAALPPQGEAGNGPY